MELFFFSDIHRHHLNGELIGTFLLAIEHFILSLHLRVFETVRLSDGTWSWEHFCYQYANVVHNAYSSFFRIRFAHATKERRTFKITILNRNLNEAQIN